jgi:hypothetical protein
LRSLPARSPTSGDARSSNCAPSTQRSWPARLNESSIGRWDQADDALERLIQSGGDAVTIEIAEVYAWHGDDAQALDWLARATARLRDLPEQKRRCDDITEAIRFSPCLQSMRDDPRWQTTVALDHRQ